MTTVIGDGDLYYFKQGAWRSLKPVVATGGTAVDIVDGGIAYRVHTFVTSDDFEVLRGGEVEYLIVAGGGGGGFGFNADERWGGGGGAGGVIQASAQVTTGTLPVVVGSGATGGANFQQPAPSGSPSEFLSAVAVGGGGGGSTNSTPGVSGGSGGGGSRSLSATKQTPDNGPGGSGTSGQGNDGATASPTASGGGGGFAAAGGNPTGGAGLVSTFTGTSVTYAVGGDGRDETGDTTGADATTIGGGGQGGRRDGSGGGGGDGIVIIRYRI